jgi:hypothetical protein
MANLARFPIADLKVELDKAYTDAHSELLKGGESLPREEVVRLATIVLQAHQLSTMTGMVQGVMSTLIDALATSNAPKSSKEH